MDPEKLYRLVTYKPDAKIIRNKRKHLFILTTTYTIYLTLTMALYLLIGFANLPLDASIIQIMDTVSLLFLPFFAVICGVLLYKLNGKQINAWFTGFMCFLPPIHIAIAIYLLVKSQKIVSTPE